MPYGARPSLAALILSLTLGVTGAGAQSASGWTDPPARKPAAPSASPAEPQKAAPPPASTPAAAAPATARKAVAAQPVRKRLATRHAAPAAKRVAATPHRPRIAAAAPARTIRAPRMVAVAPPPPPPRDDYPRYRAYNYGPGYADERLERLRAAEAAGYLVVRRRTVEFPDGRSLRVYRPDDEGEPF
ncbi:hypothetical protein [Methylobacterium pseudosasicola]|uniref:Uncharacterized protein n=1 Tax=Methylobacterium pseudosasicola TaxID=582667 RepID=A0A1I4GAV7_9HYPH|nr:hypothetical protein [Methylobacterium pseudosasicola]SFL26673.1 hypothetical protein SAMN05192568_1002285 [Methylobacterium pseudosasicola]